MDELLFYKEWTRIVTQALHDELQTSDMYRLDEDFKMYIDDSYAKKQKEIEHDFSTGNIKDLLRYFKDMNELAMEMEPCEKRALNARLRAVCGKDLSYIDKRLANSIKRIVRRGKIRNGEEYEKVRTYIDSIEGEPGQEALLNDLYRLVGEFEMSVGDNSSLVGDEWR